jgi:hypothetical protein
VQRTENVFGDKPRESRRRMSQEEAVEKERFIQRLARKHVRDPALRARLFPPEIERSEQGL